MNFQSFGQHKAVSDMTELPPYIHHAVQQALTNIWFGHVAPIEEAIESTNRGLLVPMHPWQVEEQLARYINLIVLQLRQVPEEVDPFIEARMQMLQEYLAKGFQRVQQLEQEYETLSVAIQEKVQTVSALRQKIHKLEVQERSLERRLLELVRAEREVQEHLAAIAGREPVTLGRARVMAEAIAQATRGGIPKKA